MKKLQTRKGGFTLIELMIVVAIIGILAAIAIPNFLRFQLKAKSSEGKTNLAAIRTAEQSYYSEFGVYVSADVSPAGAPGSAKRVFSAQGNNNGGTGPGFTTLGWSPEGNVYFGYAVGTGAVGASFFATAEANIDADANRQTWGYQKAVPAVAAKTHTCDPTANGQPQDQVVPCTGAMGQSIF